MLELKHYGIPGMKWGVRRDRPGVSQDHARSRSLRSKRLSDLSNDELKLLTTRMRLEREYKQLNQSAVSAGAKWVGDVVSSSGKDVAKQYATRALGSGVEAIIAAWPKK